MAISESFNRAPVSNVTPSYLYIQYSDDEDLQAFVDAYNEVAQYYLDWFNNHPLAVYTEPGISGRLLDWVGQGVYGVQRPLIGSFKVFDHSALNTVPMNAQAMNTNTRQQVGSARYVSDDIYKRVLTWLMYLGDGKQMSLEWLRRRIARFLYGSNGGDISADELQNVYIGPKKYPAAGQLMARPLNASALNSRYQRDKLMPQKVFIKAKRSQTSKTLQELIASGTLPTPFQLTIEVTLYD